MRIAIGSDVWFATSTTEGEAHSEWNQQQIELIRQLEEKYRKVNDEGPLRVTKDE